MAITLRKTEAGKPETADLYRLKNALFNVEAAQEVRRLAAESPHRFDAQVYEKFIAAHPIFSKLHLLSEDDD